MGLSLSLCSGAGRRPRGLTTSEHHPLPPFSLPPFSLAAFSLAAFSLAAFSLAAFSLAAKNVRCTGAVVF